MKKLYTLAFMALAAVSMNAQNVITNGSFETWNTATPPAPEGWMITLGANGGSVTQETTLAHTGTSSAKLTAPTGTGNNRVGFADFPVTAGQTYTISYWYNDQTDAARFRHWGSFRNEGGVTGITQSTIFQPDYLPNTTGWQFVTVSDVAPAGATILRLDFRVFQDTSGGGSVYLDDVRAGAGNLAVSENAISGLQVYPNPVTKGNLYVSSNSNEVKTVAVYDVLGKQVVKATTTSNEAINVSNLNAGVYIVKITEAGKTATRKLVVE